MIANGNVFLDPAATGAVVGRMDLTAITTAVGNTTERRQLFIEIALDPGVAPDLYAPFASLKASLLPGGGVNATDSTAATFVRALAAAGDALELSGVETYPLGGSISPPSKPLVLAVTGGTGAFFGASGGVVIETMRNGPPPVFRYTFMLL